MTIREGLTPEEIKRGEEAREHAADAAWEKEKAIYRELGLTSRPYPVGISPGQFPEPIFNREVFRGIVLGIEPEKKGYLFDFYKKEVQKVDKDIDNFAELLMKKYNITAKEYMFRKLPPAEEDMGRELGERASELLRTMNSMTYKPRQIELFEDEKEVYKFAKHLHPKPPKEE